MNVLGDIFELTVNLAEGIILSDFLCRYPGFKSQYKHKNILMALLACVNFTVISIFNYFMIFEGFWGIMVYITIAFIFSRIFLNGKLYQQIFASVSEYVLLVTMSILLVFLFSNIFHVSAEKVLLRNPELYRFLITSSIVPLFFSATRLVLKIKNKDCDLKSGQWIMLIAAPVISLVIVVSMIENSISQNRDYSEIYLIISVLLVLSMNIAIHAVIYWITRDNEITLENALLKKEKDVIDSHVAQLKELYDEITILRHDAKHYAEGIKRLIDSKKYDELRKYVDEITDKTIENTVDNICTTGNAIVDGIINYKVAYARNMGITVKVNVNYKIKNISDTNISIILGNLIDNAIEACMLQENEKLMKISIEKKKEYVMIEIINKTDKSVLNTNCDLKSTKKAAGKHGLGIKSVKNIVEKYYGMYEFYENDGFFIAEVFIHEPQI